jgi:hypothetical protein
METASVHVAHGDGKAAPIEDHSAGEALRPEGGHRRAVLGGADTQTDHRPLHALDEGGQLGDLARIVTGSRHRGNGHGEDRRDHPEGHEESAEPSHGRDHTVDPADGEITGFMFSRV